MRIGAKCRICSHAVQQFESCMRKFQRVDLLRKRCVAAAGVHKSSLTQVHMIDKSSYYNDYCSFGHTCIAPHTPEIGYELTFDVMMAISLRLKRCTINVN